MLRNFNRYKIWKNEDPIEINLAGFRQTEVKFKIGVNFSLLMPDFLRAVSLAKKSDLGCTFQG